MTSSDGSLPTVVLTGATGRLGNALAHYLNSRGYSVRALVRTAGVVPDLFDASCDWHSVQTQPDAVHKLLSGARAIVHLASSGSPSAEQQEQAHLRVPEVLLDAAERAGVCHFIALSSIKALAGEAHAEPLSPTSTPAPNSDYGRYKRQMETLIQEHAANAQLASWVLRLPMVYGPDHAGNFGLLRKMARLGVPLPVAADNQRSLLYSENLFAAIEHLVSSSASPGNRVLHLADGRALSTREFFSLIAQAQGNPGRCLTLPTSWSEGLARVPVLGGVASRLLGSLSFAHDRLGTGDGWSMPLDAAAAITHAIDNTKTDVS